MNTAKDLTTVPLDRCVGSCNTLNDLSNKVCVPNLNLSVLTWLHEEINRKHQQDIFHVNVNANLIEENKNQTNCRITINDNVSVKNIMNAKKIVWNPHYMQLWK